MTIPHTAERFESTTDYPGKILFPASAEALHYTDKCITGSDYVVKADTLHGMLGQKNLLVVDVRSLAQCPDGHIPGAVQLDYGRLIRKSGNAEGLLPTVREISDLLEDIGLTPDHFVVAYDDGAGVDAARLLWTLDLVGHQNYALLNGGFSAWDDAEYAVSESPWAPQRGYYPLSAFGDAMVQIADVFASLNNADTCLVDTRSAAEYKGEDVRAKKGGHIPGAIHFDWISAVDMTEGGVLRHPCPLEIELRSRGITKDKQIMVYCQSNRRSSHTFLVLKWLGYENVKAYAGSWSEWGNAADTPVEK